MIRAKWACGATGETTLEDSYDSGGRAVPTTWAGGAACPSGASGQPAAGTVSYTHLRAHETVLEIVCRLLLEKKKKKIDMRRISVYLLTQPT